MRIDTASLGKSPANRHTYLVLLILSIVAALLAAAYVMTRRLVG